MRSALGGLVLFATLWAVPHRFFAREAARWWRGDAVLQAQLARGVEALTARPLSPRDFHQGNGRFAGEWLFATYMMAGMGFGQTALAHPELRARHVPLIRRAVDRLLAKDARAFEVEAWGDDPISGASPHVAYLGYLNLLLSMERLLDPGTPHAALGDLITETLAARLSRAPTLLLESYPDETYAVDNCAAIGSLGLYDRATGASHRALIEKFVRHLETDSRDPKTGLLRQWTTGPARGSGTALAAYFLSFADARAAGALTGAVERELAGDVLGFGAVREYARGAAGKGDVDSGPILLGFGVSATGFALGAARATGNQALFERLYPTAHLFGAPVDTGGRREYVAGGAIGNAILFAMLTAEPAR